MAKTIVVTGASRGLGRAIAEGAVADGFRVVGLSRKGEAFSDRIDMLACDVSDAASVKAAAKPFGKDKDFWGVVHCAGIASMNLVLSTPPETVQKIVTTNLIGTINICQSFGKALVRRGEGRLINFSTIAVPLALKGEAVYAASKAGVEGFTRAFAREMADHHVTVNAIAPGPIDTDLIAKVPAASIQKIVDQQIIQKKARPEDAWAVARILLSEDSKWITGQVINLGGV